MRAGLVLLIVLTGGLLVGRMAFSRDDVSARPGESDATETTDVVLERVTTAVPWPRGIRYHEGKLLVLGRGIHRSAGGPQADIDDKAGYLFTVDPAVREKWVAGVAPGDAVRKNGVVFAEPVAPVFEIWNRDEPSTLDTRTDRPYCQLVYDDASRNFFVCAFSGIDLGDARKFRKNPTDGVHRFDLRTKKWSTVEKHDHDSVPAEECGKWIPNERYPHHDLAKNPAPHGLVNGPCGAVVCGDFLYVGAKDNTALAQYDLDEIRKDPNAGAPDSRYMFHRAKQADAVFVEVKGQGNTYIEGTSALAQDGKYLYVAFRTTSQILRFPLEKNGDLVRPLVAEKIAQFKRYDPEVKGGGSSNIYDMTFDDDGLLYVSPAYEGAVFRFTPDPAKVFDATGYDVEPYVDLRKITGNPKIRSGNICLDDENNLYICSGNKDLPEGKIRGVVYRVAATAK